MDNAPTSSIEIVTIVRPAKTIAVLLSSISALLTLISIFPTTWATTELTTQSGVSLRRTEGLWVSCLLTNKSTEVVDCVAQTQGFAKAVIVLIILATLAMTGCCGVIVFAILSADDYKKSMLYTVATCGAIISAFLLVTCLIVYPVMLDDSLRSIGGLSKATWTLNWAYALECVSAFLSLLTVALLMWDRKREETMMVELVHHRAYS